jgi:AAA domain
MKTHKDEGTHDWQDVFHSYEEFKKAPPISFAIESFLQNQAATVIGGLSGHGKTLVMLSMAKALLCSDDDAMWGHFHVKNIAKRVIYLIPESGLIPFKRRLKLFGLTKYTKQQRLLVRTLSKGPAPSLSDKRILAAAEGAHVFLDTVVRFGEGDENHARDNQQLASAFFALLKAGARTVVGAHHSPKQFARDRSMTLENVLRGSGDIGAMVDAAWGIKQLDASRTIIHIENIKARDFAPCKPFQLIGRPHIDDEGNFRMYKEPGECRPLEEELRRKASGALQKASERRAAIMGRLRRYMKEDPKATGAELCERFAKHNQTIKPGTMGRYCAEIRKEDRK